MKNDKYLATTNQFKLKVKALLMPSTIIDCNFTIHYFAKEERS